MKILHLVKVIFDRRTPAITDEWLKERYGFFGAHTYPSLLKNTFTKWDLWASFGVNTTEADCVGLLPHVICDATHWTFNPQHAPDKALQDYVRELDVDYVYVTRIDSDDLYAPDALQLANDCRPKEPGRVEASMFRRGFMYDIANKQLGVYHGPSTPFHTMMIPKDVFCDPAKYAAMDYGDHSKVNSRYPTQVLPDWRFTVLIHGRNFLSTMNYANEPNTPVEKGWTYERFLQQPVTFDIDDFCSRWDCLPELDRLKEHYPNFKCTLFTIPGMSGLPLIAKANGRDWVEIAYHGLSHDPNEELKLISPKGLYNKLSSFQRDFEPEASSYVKGFRPPGWYITKEHIKVLNELGMWVALHQRDEKLLAPLCTNGYYVCNESKPYWHGHTSGEGQRAHSVCGNGIRECLPDLLKKWPKDQQFSFVSDSVLVPQAVYNQPQRSQG